MLQLVTVERDVREILSTTQAQLQVFESNTPTLPSNAAALVAEMQSFVQLLTDNRLSLSDAQANAQRIATIIQFSIASAAPYQLQSFNLETILLNAQENAADFLGELGSVAGSIAQQYTSHITNVNQQIQAVQISGFFSGQAIFSAQNVFAEAYLGVLAQLGEVMTVGQAALSNNAVSLASTRASLRSIINPTPPFSLFTMQFRDGNLVIPSA